MINQLKKRLEEVEKIYEKYYGLYENEFSLDPDSVVCSAYKKDCNNAIKEWATLKKNYSIIVNNERIVAALDKLNIA